MKRNEFETYQKAFIAIENHLQKYFYFENSLTLKLVVHFAICTRVDEVIPEGKRLIIVGQFGVGKTILANLVRDVCEDTVVIDGEDPRKGFEKKGLLSRIDPSSYRHRIETAYGDYPNDYEPGIIVHLFPINWDEIAAKLKTHPGDLSNLKYRHDMLKLNSDLESMGAVRVKQQEKEIEG